MTTPTGTISFSDITAEFGTPPGKNIGAYRVNQSIAGRNWTLDSGVPSSGSISFSQLRGKTLNVVVDYSGDIEYGISSDARYNSSGVAVGGFRTRPSATSGSTKKVYHVIRKVLGGGKAIEGLYPRTYSRSSIYFNSLGPYITVRRIPESEWPIAYNLGWRGVIRRPPPDSTTTTQEGTSGNRSLTGGSGSGAIVSFIKYKRVKVRSTWVGRNFSVIETTEIFYTYTIVSGGSNYLKNQFVTTNWDGRTFTFRIDDLDRGFPALRTGTSWSAATLNYIIASGGQICGSGGDGGNAAGQSSLDQITSISSGFLLTSPTYTRDVFYDGFRYQSVGGNGGYGFGASYPCSIIVETGGRLQGGGGAGGGGGSGYSDPGLDASDPVCGGGGGGGGFGLPSGNYGLRGIGAGGGNPGKNGFAGSLTAGGNGGAGGNNVRGSIGGGGGGGSLGGLGGASQNQNGSNATSTAGGKGGNGRGGVSATAGLIGGLNGSAIVYNSGVTVSLTLRSGSTYIGGSAQGTFLT